MPDLDGLSFIPMLNPKPMIILTTAYDQYALKAYELEVKDYLLKPFTFERFYKGVLRLYQEQSPRRATGKEGDKTRTEKRAGVHFSEGGPPHPESGYPRYSFRGGYERLSADSYQSRKRS